jgi:transposase
VSSSRKRYSKEFKVEAVRLIKQQGMTYRQVSEDLGINVTLLTRWVKALKEKGEHAFLGHGKLPPRDEALRQLQEENRRLRMERDILKKAAAYFARNQE